MLEFDQLYSSEAAEMLVRVASNENGARKLLSRHYSSLGLDSVAWFYECTSKLAGAAVDVACNIPGPSKIWLGVEGELGWRSWVPIDAHFTDLYDLQDYRAIVAVTAPGETAWQSRAAIWWARSIIQLVISDPEQAAWRDIELASRVAISAALDTGLVGPIGWDQPAEKLLDLSLMFRAIGDDEAAFLAAALVENSVVTGEAKPELVQCDWLLALARDVSVATMVLPDGSDDCLAN